MIVVDRRENPPLFVDEYCLMIIEGYGPCSRPAEVKVTSRDGQHFIFLCLDHFRIIEPKLEREGW